MKGLLITADMLRAYVEGRKTLTRRLDNLKEINQEPDSWNFREGAETLSKGWLFSHPQLGNLWIKPPYRVGEVVYLKEAFYVQPELWDEGHGPQPLHYLADAGLESYEDYILKSPLFMPAWAARHFQRIKDVRPERLQAITEEDIQAEGIDVPFEDWMSPWAQVPRYCQAHFKAKMNRFSTLWDSLYPKYPWSSSPWAWRIESERAERPEEAKCGLFG